MNGNKTSGVSSPTLSSQLISGHTSPFMPSKQAMDAPAFVPQGLRSATSASAPYQLPMPAQSNFERESVSNPIGSPYPPAILIKRLPLKTTNVDSLRNMFVWSKDFLDAELLPSEAADDWVSALVRFKDIQGAQEAQLMLHGKPNIANDASMIVEIIQASPTLGRRYPTENIANQPFNTGTASSTSSGSSAGPTPRQSSRFNGTFQSMERISPPNTYTSSNELPNPDSGSHYQNLFSPQSPIGNHLTERSRISGKSLNNDDTVDDDETGELLKDPVAYAENGSSVHSRRGTNAQLPIARMGSLSLNTSTSPGAFPSAPLTQIQPAPMSPTLMSSGAHFPLGGQQFPRSNFPPVNPADQNPPCNTLYVGNLPIDTSEDELKAMFSKQRGYKRLCFRTKQNGPMCFVEFEDVTFATKALHELYGHPLHNSIKGGIRLSFSKNPLGVRSGQGLGTPAAAPPGVMQGMMNGGSGASFSSVNGPPPGLTAPPGLGPSRVHYGAVVNPMANGYNFAGGSWNGGPGYNGPMMNQAASMNGGANGFPPAYMMGR